MLHFALGRPGHAQRTHLTQTGKPRQGKAAELLPRVLAPLPAGKPPERHSTSSLGVAGPESLNLVTKLDLGSKALVTKPVLKMPGVNAFAYSQ